MSVWSSLLAVVRGGQDTDDGIPRGERLQEAFEIDADAFLNLTAKLKRSDLELIGRVVQLYSHCDLNARRIIAAIEHASTGQPREPSRHQDGKVIPALNQLAQEYLPEGPLKHGILRTSAILLMHRDHRHRLAHWATLRIRGVDALVMFTMNANAAEKSTQVPLGAQQSRFGIISLPGFRDEIRKLEEYGAWLARAAAHIDTHLVELSEKIADRHVGEQTGQGDGN